MTYRITMIANEDVAEVLPLVAGYLREAVDAAQARTSFEIVVNDLLTAKASLWIGYDTEGPIDVAFVTRVSRYPLKRMLLLELAGGQNMERWLPKATEVFRQFAIDSKLDGVEIYGRRGWARALAPYGVRETIVVSEIDLRQGPENVQ